jgi:hypothetical protein
VLNRPVDLPVIELVTETSWISGQLSRDQSSDAANLSSVLNINDYGLRGRSLIESGRLVDILNRESGYISVCEARIQPLLSIQLLDRSVDQVAVTATEILCASPLQQEVSAPPGPEPASTGAPSQPERERRTIVVQVGPILVSGDLHIIRGSDPVAAFFQRDVAFVPLTSATATYLPDPQRKWIREVLIVNRLRTQLLMAEAAAP